MIHHDHDIFCCIRICHTMSYFISYHRLQLPSSVVFTKIGDWKSFQHQLPTSAGSQGMIDLLVQILRLDTVGLAGDRTGQLVTT